MPNMIKKSLTVSNGNEVVINCHNVFTVADETKHFIQCLLCMYKIVIFAAHAKAQVFYHPKVIYPKYSKQ